MNLHMKSKVFSIHKKAEILDEEENIVYTIESKAISIHNKTYIRDANGNQISYIYRKPISLHETHFVEMNEGQNFELRTEWFHIAKDIINVNELGWSLHGDFFGHNYEIADENGALLASTHLKWLSLHNIFYIDIFDDSKMDLIISLYVALERIMQDRISTSSSDTTTTGGGSSN